MDAMKVFGTLASLGVFILLMYSLAAVPEAAVALVVGFVYFLPTVIANSRDHHNTSGIVLLNLLIGWTFIGWIIALAMACGEVKAEPAE